MSEEEIKLLNEMKDNCLNQSKYIDVKAMDKYNLLRKLEEQNKQLSKEMGRLKEQNAFLMERDNVLQSLEQWLIKQKEDRKKALDINSFSAYLLMLDKINELKGDNNAKDKR